MKRILTITLNPAIDITTAVAELVPGPKMRCEAPRIEPGGGGVNVSRVIKELGGKSLALVAVAGATGTLMRELLAEAEIETAFLEARGLTRQSLAVHDRASGKQYRFVLPGPAQDTAFAEQALATLKELLADGTYPYVVASGSLPPGLPDGFFGEIAEFARARGARLILDTSGPALRAALGCGVFLVKPDQLEARALAASLGVDAEDPARLARSILENGGAEAVVVTLDAEGALLASEEGSVRLRAPKVQVVSKVGAGDSFVGAVSFALANGWPLARACGYGVAAAAAAVTTPATELARKADVDRLYAALETLPSAR